MIAYLSGKPLLTATLTAIVINGVGYAVQVTTGTRSAMQQREQVELFIYTHVKEEAFDLYGFLTEEERVLFTKLIEVNGVGPKTALAIMDKGVAAIIHAVQAADISLFQSVPRVGKKSAQKIIIELKSKLGGTQELILTEPEGKAKDVVEALASLGFSQAESMRVVKTMDLESLRVEDAVKQAIRALTTK